MPVVNIQMTPDGIPKMVYVNCVDQKMRPVSNFLNLTVGQVRSRTRKVVATQAGSDVRQLAICSRWSRPSFHLALEYDVLIDTWSLEDIELSTWAVLSLRHRRSRMPRVVRDWSWESLGFQSWPLTSARIDEPITNLRRRQRPSSTLLTDTLTWLMVRPVRSINICLSSSVG